MNSSLDASKDKDEFVLLPKKRKSRLVNLLGCSSPVNLECKLLKTLKLKSNSKKYTTMIIGEGWVYL